MIIALFGAIYFSTGSIVARRADYAVRNSTFGLVALGDTGKRHRPLAFLSEGQMAVANAMIGEDRKNPADALVFLGDIFYMKGLRSFELVPRVRQNLVYPYCHFLRLDGPRSHEIASACRESRGESHPIPIFAVLGNHDFESEESPGLQRDVVPEFIPNWYVLRDYAEARELGEGVSLVLLDSEVQYRTNEDYQVLVAALRAADGPWRILAAHSPMAIGEWGNVPELADHSLGFEQFVSRAIEESGVRVHLYLAGHHHSLQVIEGKGGPGPALHVIAGGGARWRDIERPHPRRRFGLGRLGFARVDLAARGNEQELVVSVFKSATIPLTSWGGPSLRARWSIKRDGRVRDLLLEGS